ncbi:MAG TPA: thiolase family protein [Candidatus Binatia bacterium]|nr:thiolase family protein [Candidatus Binatia bacterium]
MKGTIESAPELRGRAAVAGIAELRPSKTPEGRTPLGLIADASRLAIADAGLRPADVDGIVVCPAMMQYSMLWPSVVAEHLGLSPSYLEFVDLGGASSCGMIARAAAAVATGRADVVLCVNGDTWDPKGMYLKPPPLISPLRDFTMPYGAAGANGDYAMAAKLHMARYGTTSRQLAKIAADQRTSAQKNPLALFHGKPLTVDDVLASPLVCDPLHLLEVVMPCTGAEAVIVTSAERARDLPHPPALVLGFGEHLEPDPFQRPDYLVTPVVESARRAFGMAGVVPRDVDFAEIYDCYTSAVLIELEDAGFCAKGEGGPFVESHDLTYAGDFPLNTHGGMLSFGQPGLGGGMTLVVEAVRQIMGRAGERQVARRDVAFVHGNGGTFTEECSLVLGAAR